MPRKKVIKQPSKLVAKVAAMPIKADIRITPAEERLLTALCDPTTRQFTVVEKCEAAGISKDTYYRAIQKPAFIDLVGKLALAMVKEMAAPLVNTGIHAAQMGSFQHWKVLMEMGGLYDPKRMFAEEDSGGVTIRFVDPRAQPERIDVSPQPGPDLDDD